MNNFFIQRKSCPVCSNNDFKTIYSKNYCDEHISSYLKDFYELQGGIVDLSLFQNAKYELGHCHQCNLIFQINIPGEGLMNLVYGKMINLEMNKAKHIEEFARDERIKHRNSSEISYLLRKLKSKYEQPIKFLDFGMGWAQMCESALEFGFEVYGVELSEEKMKYALQKGINVIHESEIQDHNFDIINVSQVLEHVSHPSDLLALLSNSLKNGGVIRISVPYEREAYQKIINCNMVDVSSRTFNVVAPLEHINFFSNNTLKYLGETSRLNYAGCMNYSYPLCLSNSVLNKIKYIIKKYFLFSYNAHQSTDLIFVKK